MAAESKIFLDIYNQAIAKGILNTKTKTSLDWFRNKIQKASSANDLIPIQNIKEIRNTLQRSRKAENRKIFHPGQLYSFRYDPKYKQTLPYYDEFPLILTLESDDKYILGLNFHYIYPIDRAYFFNQLWKLEVYNSKTKSQKINVSYDLLKNSPRFRYYEPCLKLYLIKKIQTIIIPVERESWEIALFLPTERFKKQTKRQVWIKSRKFYQ